MDLPSDLEALVQAQYGVFTRRQAMACGLTVGDIKWALGRRWISVLPGVYLAHRGSPQRAQLLMAGQLYAGEEAVLSGPAACRWRGLEQASRTGVVHVIVPTSRSSRQIRWLHIRRSSLPAGLHPSGPLRLATVERAVVDAARLAPGLEDATALVIEALQRRLTTLERLAHTNDALGRPGSALTSRALRAAAGGAWSIPELALGRLVRSSRVLPEMWCNPRLTTAESRLLVMPDGWFDDVGMAVMVHSRRWHDGSRSELTVERDGELTAYGVVVCAITPRSIEREPARVLDFLERTYAATRATRTRTPAVTATQWDPYHLTA
ncbi:MAG: hypothetical protein LCH98_04610 [Actinobacteria bacterium]|nr:hypothetical protein [Actinomycetota bacterium]